ncbi:MAG: cation:proton antiporter [Muribaculaceae bacterium]|nr:cation:proton antiporter [Muribaculaceae bacterium]
MITLPSSITSQEDVNLGENTEAIIKNTYTEINDEAPAETDKEAINNGLIADLALILLLGAVVTLLFKKLKQPVVLGYILAGFLASPNFTYLPTISNLENIEFWADLGIVVLMFTLGLEFSFRKLMNSGSSAIITALIIITGMTFAGFGVGKILDLNPINCIFLGGMISMSSTTIILKTLTDLGMRQKKFASLVLAVLIIEDLFAVLMLVLLSSIAVGNVEGKALLFSIGKLLFFLIIWFLVGVYVLPSFLAKVKHFLNDETLLVVAMGLCFSMAIFSVICGFSLELGAFVMGSILAGTMVAERMEKVVKPVKDLFGAVFFISVGMMVDPSVLVNYWWEILILAGVVICGMIFFGTFGMLMTGQTLRVAIESGFTLTQVGEFSFIIAALGMSLGVLEHSIYPIIVAVSVITIFTTPYFVKLSQPAYRFVESKLPENLRFLIDRYSKQVVDTNTTKQLWKDILSRYLGRMVIFSVILIAIILVSRQFLFPLLEEYMSDWGRFLATVITLSAMMPFLFALSFSSIKPDERMKLHASASFYDVPLVALRIIRYFVALLFIVYLLTLAYDATVAWIAGIICLAFIIVFASQKISARYAFIEKKFIDNLNIRENTRSGVNNKLIDDLHMAYIEVGAYCPFVGDKLKDSGLRNEYGVSIASIQRGERTMPLPSVDARIFPGDILGVIGNDEQIKRLNDDIERDEKAYRSVEVFNSKVELRSLTLSDKSPVINVPLGETDIRKDFYCMIVKVQRGEDVFEQPGADTILRDGDIVWVVGDPEKMEEMK